MGALVKKYNKDASGSNLVTLGQAGCCGGAEICEFVVTGNTSGSQVTALVFDEGTVTFSTPITFGSALPIGQIEQDLRNAFGDYIGEDFVSSDNVGQFKIKVQLNLTSVTGDGSFAKNYCE